MITWDACARANARRSIVLGAFENPRPDILADAVGQRPVPKRHAQLGVPIDQPEEVAVVGFARDHHGPVVGPFHQSFIRCEIESAGVVAFASGLVA